MSEEMPNVPAEDQSEQSNQFHIDYIKSNQFRVLHVDGAWGGLTAHGFIHMVLFSERPPIPKQTTHEMTVEGTITELPQFRIVRDAAAVREMEVAAMLSLNVAKKIREWLDDKINQMIAVQEAVKAEHAETKQAGEGDTE